MQSALLILLICAAIDIVGCGLLLAVVWVEHRRMRKEAATLGETVPSAAGEFGCLFAFGLAGLFFLYGTAWLFLR
jgi:hypothetical protein